MIYTAHYHSHVGGIHLAEKDGGLIGLWIDGQKFNFDIFKDEIKQETTPLLNKTLTWLDSYFNGEKPDIQEIPLTPVGGIFRQTVWQILREIPYGETKTYGDVAKEAAIRLGKEKMSAQAIGGAVGHNQISIIIPCHRVIGANGNLTGYTGGIMTKIKLLEQEGVDMTSFYIPNNMLPR